MPLSPVNSGGSLPVPAESKYNRKIDHQYFGTPGSPIVGKGAATPTPAPSGESVTPGSVTQSFAAPTPTSAVTISISAAARGEAQLSAEDTLS